jgi:LysM repeat protein
MCASGIITTKMRNFFSTLLKIIICLIILFGLSGWQPQTVQAGSITAYDLINEVNAVRASYGLSALIVDPILMYTAQATAETMAAQDLHWHIGDVRGRVIAAGYGNGNAWATENFSMGMNKSLNDIVYVDWADSDHMIPMTNANYIHIGAGVAELNGTTWYVVQAAYPAGGNYVAGDTTTTTVSGTADTSQYVSAIVVSTMQPDGSILHPILQGQVLYNIALAYGVTVDELVTLNRLSPSNPVIYQGNDLLIQASYTPTIEPTATETPLPPTATLTRTATLPPPRATNTPTLSLTPTRKPLLPNIPTFEGGSQQSLGVVLIIICAVGIGLILFGSLKK